MWNRIYFQAAGSAAILAAALEFQWQVTLNLLTLKPPAALTAAGAAIIAAAVTFILFWVYAWALGPFYRGAGRAVHPLASFVAAVGAPQLWFAAYYLALPPTRLAWLAAFGLGIFSAPALAIPAAYILARAKIALALGVAGLATLTALAVAAPLSDRRSPGDHRPHVILFTLDTTRADRLGCYGYADARTPRLDALAAHGVRFRRAVCLEPLTAPSHATMMTSLYPVTTGIELNGERLTPGAHTLAQSFAAAGYETAAFVGGSPVQAKFTGLDRGFKVYDDGMTPAEGYRSTPLIPKPVAVRLSLFPKDENDAERPAGAVTTAAAHWLKRRSRRRPFFLWVHYFDPHDDYFPPAAYVPRGIGGPLTRKRWNERWAAGAADDRTRGIIATLYNGEIAYMDAQLGRLLDAVAVAVPGESTLILVAGDHGEAFREHGTIYHGFRLYHEETDIPFIVAGLNAKLPAAAADAGVVSTLDVAPTLLDLAGLPVPASMRGRRLFGPDVAPAAAFAICVPEPRRASRSSAGPLKAWITASEKIIVSRAGTEYYNLINDPGEMMNRAGADSARVAELKATMTAFGLSLPRVERTRGRPADAERDRKLRALGYIK